MKYVAIERFRDTAVDGTVYEVNASYPVPSASPDEKHIAYLMSDVTSFKAPVIQEVRQVDGKDTKDVKNLHN